MKHLVKSLVAAAATFCVAGSAFAADPIDITSYSFSGLSGFNVTGVVNETVSAGQIGITTDAGSFLTYCIELTELLNIDKAYVVDKTYANDLVSRLFNVSGFFSPAGVASLNDKAALQVAIWEAIYDGGPGNFSAGNFRVTGADATATAAIGTAGNFLLAANALAPNSYVTSLWAFKSAGTEGIPGSQDLVTAVPEPGTYALMLAGLAGIGFVARRRSASRS